MIIDLDYLLNFLLNYIFIVIPLTFISVCLTLLLLKEYKYFKTQNLKTSIIDILIVCVLPTSFFFNYIYYFTNVNFFTRIFINSILYFIFINRLIKFNLKEYLWNKHLEVYKPENLYFSQKFNNLFRRETNKYVFTIENNKAKVIYKNKIGMYICITLVMILHYILEISTSLYLQYVININMKTLNTNIFDSIFISYPALFILSFCSYLGYVYINTGKLTLIDIWKKNKKFRIVTYIQGITTFIFSILMYVYVLKDNLLHTLTSNLTFRIAIIIYMLLISYILVPWMLICREEVLKYKLKYGNI